MNKAAVKDHLDSIIGEDYQNLNDVGFMIAICKVYNTIRPVLIFIKPFLKLKKGWGIAAEAFILLMDSRCKINNSKN